MLRLGKWAPTLNGHFADHPVNMCSVTSSKSGIVNVYGSNASSSWSNSDRPKPFKTIGNLTTSISAVQFNHDSQLLAIASKTQKDQMRLVWLVLCRSNRLYAYGQISRSISRLRTGQRPARRLGTSLASISRQVANTLLLVTLVDVFCYITSKITTHTECHDDQETSYYVHALHASEGGVYQVAKAAETSSEEQRRRGKEGRAKHSKSTAPRDTRPRDQSRSHEPKRSMRWVYVSVI